MSGETDQGAWIEKWAERIEALGLSPIALPLLQVARAFGFLGGQALLIVQPLVAGVISDAALERTATLLDSPELLEELRARLEVEDR